MGTRSLTVFIDDDKTELAVMYRQYDGYPDGLSMELKEFLGPMRIVNGFSQTTNIANGMKCLAAQVFAKFKEGCGNVYFYPAGTREVGEEFIYFITVKDGVSHIKCTEGRITFFGQPGTPPEDMKVLYDGPAAEFNVPVADE